MTINVPILKQGESIVNRNPYPGEGEYMVAQINVDDREVKVIHCLNEKHSALNGHTTTIPFDAIFKSYKMVDGSPIRGKRLDTAKTPGQQVADFLNESMEEAVEEVTGMCSCHGQMVVAIGGIVICFNCGKPKGRVGDFIFEFPENLPEDAKGVMAFEMVSTEEEDPPIFDLPVGFYQYESGEMSTTKEWLMKDDDRPWWLKRTWFWERQFGSVATWLEIDFGCWHVLPFIRVDFRGVTVNFGWLPFNFQLDFSGDG